jgi:hypothetical protein
MVARPLYTEVSMLDLERLLDEAEDGAIALPDFQRPFVWTTQMVRSVLATVLNGWPIGTLLLTRGDLQEFRLKPITGAPSLQTVKYVVLDGQQRLTALYNALRGAGETVYALNFSKNLNADSVGESPSIEERLQAFDSQVWANKYSHPSQQLQATLMPMTALMSAPSFFGWRDRMLEDASDDVRADLSQWLTDFYKTHLSSIHRYSVPVVLLESSLDVSTVASIFEKLNRSGTRLSTFDLMVARVYRAGWNLREEWDRARIERPLLDVHMDRDAMPVLQAIALRRVGDVRQDAVLSMRDQVRDDWSAAIDGAEAAARFLIECGLDDPAWLPYGVQMVALTALGLESGIDDKDATLKRWFWARSFGQGFDVAANTRIVTDYRRLLANELDLDSVVVDGQAIATATRQSARAIWGATLCLLTVRGGTDLLGLDPDRQLIASRDDRSGPRKYVAPALPRTNGDASHLAVLNLAITGRRGVGLIRRLGLSRAIEVAAEEVGEDRVERALDAQFFPNIATMVNERWAIEDMIAFRLMGMRSALAGLGVNVADG